ncbi:hypothetical protein I4F81_007456 [Pyropia yezoensis]|uniref:Uncharacterized protein n=1 Tax=Pyropia yezoensis TaxID=2788 RepID=A0ACC3C4L4_PYRYE|nr:hypothetical protein I4F81_007456 [Neopyropia yezoensis]
MDAAVDDTGVHVCTRLMDRAEASGKTKVSHDCVRFFEALGVADTGKAQTLARLLQIFNDAAGKLDAQLASLGGHLHASVSRMCKPENLWAPPQHKSIRVVDRSGFFSDTDVHAYRVVNVGLSHAKVSRWAVDIDIAAVHEAISQLGIASARYFNKHNLPMVVTLQRVGPNIRTTILISIATMLMTSNVDGCEVAEISIRLALIVTSKLYSLSVLHVVRNLDKQRTTHQERQLPSQVRIQLKLRPGRHVAPWALHIPLRPSQVAQILHF